MSAPFYIYRNHTWLNRVSNSNNYIQVGSGADTFLADRARRTANVRTRRVGDDNLSHQARVLSYEVPSNGIVLKENRTPHQAHMWNGQDFVPAHLQSATLFWQDVILQETPEPDRAQLLGWVKGVCVHDFVDPSARGSIQSHQYDGGELTQIFLSNHVPDEFRSWVTTEVEALVTKGCVVRWADVADTTTYEKPHMILPLGIEPKKPQLIWDARWLNLMCHFLFSMDGVGKVAQCA